MAILLPFGVDPEIPGRGLVHISQVPVEKAGLECGLLCPACQRRLVAYKRVTKKVEHFGHEKDAACEYGLESALHLYAKQLIEQKRTVLLPAGITRSGLDAFPEKLIEFDRVDLERRFHEVIPDIIAWRRQRQLMIEVFVTHPCDERKADLVAKRGVPMVEIDLSGVAEPANLTALDEVILESAPRRWVFHPLIAKLDAEWAAKEQEREDRRRKAEEARRAEAERLQPHRRAQNRAWVTAALLGLLEQYPEQTRTRFSIDRWFRRRLRWGYLPEEHLDTEREAEELVLALNGQRNAIREGCEPEEDMLGLMAEGIRAQDPQVECEAQVIQNSQSAALGDVDPVDRLLAGGPSPWVAARDVEAEEAERRSLAESETERCRQVLRCAAEELYGPGRAPHWLNVTNSGLRGKPLELVKDEVSLQKCLAQLETDSRQRLPARYRR